MSYATLKIIHMLSVIVSGGFFLVRGIWMLNDSPSLQRKWVKVLPHVIDTVLLVSALGLCFMLGQYPFTVGWLTAKFLLLILYIVLGTVAIKRGKTKQVRLIAFLLALAVFLLIGAIAGSHGKAIGL